MSKKSLPASLAASAQPAKSCRSDSQIRGYICEVCTTTYQWEIAAKSLVALSCREGKTLFVRLMKPSVLILVNDSAPVCQVYLSTHQLPEVCHRYAERPHRLYGFHKLLAGFVVIQLIHAENHRTICSKRCGNLLDVQKKE